MKKIVVIIIVATVAFLNTNAQTANYIYDNLQRLTETQYPNGVVVKYTYDANGNRTQHIITNTVQQPDLIIQNGTSNVSSIGAGSALNISCINFNSGVGTASAHKVIYFLSTNNTYENTDTPLDSVFINSLSAASGYNLQNRSVTIPTATTAGNYFVLIYTDARTSVAESNENNNIVALPVTVINCNSLSLGFSVVQPLCGQANGSITLNANGGVAPYQYSINNGTTYVPANLFNSLNASTYNCKVKDANGCEKTQMVILTAQNGTSPTANFSTINSGLFVQFTNTSLNTQTYFWDFGDGTTANSSSPSHTYATSGSYTICLTASNTCGSDVKCATINVVEVNTAGDSSAAWEKQYYTLNNSNERFFAKGVMENDDSSIIIIGTKYIVANNTNCDNYSFLSQGGCVLSKNIYIHKLDKYGAPMWQTTLDGAEFFLNEFTTHSENVNIAKLPTNNNFVFAVNRQGNGVCWVQMNQGGNFVASPFRYYHYFNPGYIHNGYSNFYTVSDGVILVTRIQDGINNKMLIGVTKLSSDGNTIIWAKDYHIDANGFTWAMPLNLIQLADGNLLITGVLGDNNLFNIPIANSDALVLKINNANGNVMFTKAFDIDTKYQNITSVVQLPNSDVMLGGYTKDRGPYLIQLNSTSGNQQNGAVLDGVFNGKVGLLTFENNTLKAVSVQRGSAILYKSPINYTNSGISFGISSSKLYPTFIVNNNHTEALPIQALNNRILFSYSFSSDLYKSRHNLLKLDTAWKLNCGGQQGVVNINPLSVLNVVANTQQANSPISISASQFLTIASGNISDTTKCKKINEVVPICTLNASFDQSQNTVCVGQSILFTNTSVGNYTTAKWLVNNVQVGTNTTHTQLFSTAGTYKVDLIISNSSNCADTASAIIIIQSAITFTVATTNSQCTANNGSLTITAIGGNLPLQYSIDNGATFYNSNVFTNIAPGTYTIKVKDDLDCVATNTTVISIDNSQIQLVVDSTTIKCNGLNTGRLRVTPVGGTPSYSYLWSNGATSNEITNLTAGTYSVSATDSKGCITQKTFTLWQPTALNTVSTIVPATCIPNGSISTITNGGVVPYQYSWSNGGVATSINNLSTGNYLLTVTDDNNCIKQTNYFVPEDRRLKSNGIVIDTVNISYNKPTAEFCQNDSIKLTVPNYNDITYKWYKDGVTINGATSNTITITEQGNYNCWLKDVNTCTKNSNILVVVKNNLPDTAVIVNGNLKLCGTETVELKAVQGYSNYLWSNGITTFNNIIGSSGTYSVTITTAKGCKATSSSKSVIKHNLPNITITPSGITQLCQGDSISLKANPIGYVSYLWSNGSTSSNVTIKSSNTLTVKVIDNNGCSNLSLPKIVIVNPLPIKPRIIKFGTDSLASTITEANYKWEKWNITTLPNGTEVFSPNLSQSGLSVSLNKGVRIQQTKALYVVTLYNIFDCKMTSDTFRNTVVVEPTINISPNPTTNKVTVFVTGLINGKKYNLQLINSMGQLISYETILPINREIKYSYSLNKYPNQIFMIVLKDEYDRVIVTGKVLKGE